ncbi:uncharacterized protein STEHIDRAFT_119442 [Stereum hirsutum FP-91666 SS1]|uniref:uncharacterized protein n=1 Tax=Stereum hirsutum (strain FP-91666) TaxID=721885 RepID=UPI000440C643|nr:uncharacterized protein STEHIDRAFT_119442 [Stereum hirsutum FP-91666 SS1]EIM90445.1 hypothetical protein STEHIDRAFT_119442 [Stereum hirsutum FP-91666 SS1]
MSGNKFPWFGMTLVTTGIMGVGYLVMRTTTPTSEELYQAMAPDLRKRVDEQRAQRVALEASMKNQNATVLSDPEVAKPLWAEDPRKK